MKQSEYEKIDKKIKKALHSKTDNVFASDDMLEEIKEKIYLKNSNYGGFNMKKKIIAVSAICVLCFATLTCIAASSRVDRWVSHSYHTDDINEFPSEAQIEKEAGFCPKYVKNLSDKYSFDKVSFAESTGEDASGEKVVETKEVIFRYADKNGNKNNSISLFCNNIDKAYTESFDSDKYEKSEYNAIELNYSWSLMKCFPPDCEEKNIENMLTDEEKKLKDEGRLDISYGTKEIETDKLQSLIWYDGNVQYNILAFNTDLDKEEMINMAKTVIDA